MYYGTIKPFDIANGNGVRVSLFVSGCQRHCRGCFQPETWDFHYGKEFTAETEAQILKALEPPFVQGLSVLGGDPFELSNQASLAPFLKKVRTAMPDKDIWVWSGYVFDEDLQPGGSRYGQHTDSMLDCIDVLVDGPFMEQKKDITLQFRGSSNQRLIDVKKSREQNQTVLFDPSFLSE